MAAEGIAEPEVSSVNLVALFEACIACFNLLSAKVDISQEQLHTKLLLQKLRFFLWGDSVGLVSKKPAILSTPHPGLDNPQIHSAVVRTLNAIKTLLCEFVGVDGDEDIKDASSGSASRGHIVFTFHQLNFQMRRIQRQRSRTTFNVEHFEAKLTQLQRFVDALENSTVNLVVFEIRRERFRQSVKPISDAEIVQLLREFQDSKTDISFNTTDSAPTRVASDARKGSFNRLKKRLMGSTVKEHESTPSPRKPDDGHDRRDPSQAPGSMNAAGTIILYKLVILGDDKVGKATLAAQMIPHDPRETYDPTGDDSYRKPVEIDGRNYLIEVLDTPDGNMYTALLEQWIRDGEGFIVVYSINNRASFNRVQEFHDQIVKVKERLDGSWTPTVMLLGHDYYEDEHRKPQERDREVSFKEGQNMANHLCCDFVEASVKGGTNVDKALHDLIRALGKQRALYGL